MSSVYDDVTGPRTSAFEGSWPGVFAEDATAFGSPARVVIAAFEQQLTVGPCPWTPIPAPLSLVSTSAHAAVAAATTVADLRDALLAVAELVLLPKKGDPCLVVFDSNGNPWVQAWGPAT